jgi:Ca-activated chloride channel family protein
MLLLGLGAVAANAEQPTARTSFDAGLKAFAASNYPVASNAFLAAAADAPAAKLDPAAAHYNAALSAYAVGDLKAADDLFARAATGSDLGLQAKAYYNRGNAIFQQIGSPAAGARPSLPMPSMSTQKLEAAAASIGEAVQMYENAIALDPKDADFKANYELAVLKQQEIQQQQQQQKDQPQQDDQNQDQQQQDQKQEGQNNQQQQDQPKQEQPKQQPPEQQPQPQPANQQTSQEEQIQEEKTSEEMTPEEAAMMLDAMKAQEQSQRDQLHPFFGRPVPVEKDW